MKQSKEQKWSLKDISIAFDISTSTLRVRCQNEGYLPTTNNDNYEYYLSKNQVDKITSITYKNSIPKVIYITQTFEIYPSKMNYLEL